MTKLWPRAVVIALGASVVIPAHALEFSIGNVYGSVISFFTVGAAMRIPQFIQWPSPRNCLHDSCWQVQREGERNACT